MSKYEHQDREGQPSEFEGRQFSEIAQFIAKILPDKNLNILEIGCANGGLLSALSHLGYGNVLGIDPSPVCALNAQRLYRIRVLTCPLSDVELENGRFDFIILVSVLEHLHDLDGSLTKIYDLLSPAGKLYVEVPDATQFNSTLDAPFQEFSIEHINYFSSVSLPNLMKSYKLYELYSMKVPYIQTDTHTSCALRIVFEKTKKKDHFKFTKDRYTQSALKKYIAQSKKEEMRIQKIVCKLVDGFYPLIVWGVGTHTQRLLTTSRLSNANIIAFADSNPNYHGKQLNGIPIIAPIQLSGMKESIFISSKAFQSEIIHQIRDDLKLANEIITLYED
jgi:2-polyprenyl-3-methyl-5-hydroxy-6-metoxy-1,4-benzoquinol methylase